MLSSKYIGSLVHRLEYKLVTLERWVRFPYGPPLLWVCSLR